MTTEPLEPTGRWHRISPLSMIHQFLQFLRQLIGSPGAFAGMAAAAYAFISHNPEQALGVLAGVAVLGLLALLAAWLRFGYRLQDGVIQVRRGVFTRQRLTLQMDRIQTVRLEQPPYLRPFGLVRLSIESAGSAAQEVHLAGIPRQQADSIRQQALRLSDSAGDNAPAQASSLTEDDSETLLIRRPGDLIRYGISSPLILWGGVVVASLLSAGMRRLQDNDQAEAQVAGLHDQITQLMPLWAAYSGLLMGLTALLVLLSIGLTLLRYSGYRLQRQDDRYTTRAGLFTRREQMLRQHKIQHLSLNQNLMAWLLGRRHLQCHQIGLNVQDGPDGSRHLTAPALDQADQDRLAAQFQPGLSLPALTFNRVSPRVMLPSLILWHLVWLATLVAVVLSDGNGLLLGLTLFALPLISLVSWLKWRRLGWCLNNGYLVLRRGLAGTSYVSFAPFRAQMVTLSATPLQRRRGLCNLVIGLSSGAFHIPYMEKQQAIYLMDHLLNDMASSKAPWL